MQDLHPTGTKHCLACVQWDGRRTYEREQAKIKADAGQPGWCRVKRENVKGSHICQCYDALR